MRAIGRLLLAAVLVTVVPAGCGTSDGDGTDFGPITLDAGDTGHDARDNGFDPGRDSVVQPEAGTDESPEAADTTPPGDAPGTDTTQADPGTPDAEPDAEPDTGTDTTADAPPTGGVFWLTLLHTSDTESAMLASDGFGGVAFFATKVKALQADAAAWTPPAESGVVPPAGTLTVSAGDNFLAGLNFKASLAHGVPLYETTVLQDLGYDVVSLGNHDFDFGPETLADFIRGFDPAVPVVATNLDVSAEPSLQAQVTAKRLAKSATVEVAGQRIGVVAAITDELPSLSKIGDVEVLAVAASVQAEVDALTGTGVDKIVLLSHLQAVGNDKLLVPKLHGVDIVVSGGGHEVPTATGALLIPNEKTSGAYPEKVADADGTEVPIVAAGSLYRYVGRLVVKFDAGGRVVAVDGTRSGPQRVANKDVADAVAADAGLQAAVAAPVEAAVAATKANVLGDTDVPLDGLRADIRTAETNLGDLVADALLWQGKRLAGAAGVAVPVVGLQNAGGIRNNSVLPPGNLTEYATFSVLPFSNFEAVVPNVSRDTFKALLENAVSKVELVDGRFLQVAGFRFQWDAGQPARALDAAGNVTVPGSRVRSVVLDDGTILVKDGAVVAGAALSVATIDFEANGGDQSPYGDVPFTILDSPYQRALQDYLVTGLAGKVRAADYPAGGAGRITGLNYCGNGLVEGTEACDDRNVAPADGCSAACAIEDGFTCSGSPSVCQVVGSGCDPAVVISQVYGGGGNANATWTHDYVELHNRGKADADVSGWSVQYASAAGTTWKANVLPDGTTIPGGRYLLIRLATNGAVGTALPTPDVDLPTGSNMSGTDGKVALVDNGTALSGCPAAGTVVDFVAYGSGTCGEGDSAAGKLSSANAAWRNGGGTTPATGCDDTDVNSADFTVAAASPRNLASPAASCACEP